MSKEQNILIKPTIGRIVLYADRTSSETVPAIITKVHNDSCINIMTFNKYAAPVYSVFLNQNPDSGHIDGEARWMEYQHKHAK